MIGPDKPAVDRTYPLSEVATAIRDLMDGGARGKTRSVRHL
jgi:NADPH:quinone reductase-like Zn-dependent oxidoreductase